MRRENKKKNQDRNKGTKGETNVRKKQRLQRK